jgi:8-oxo-dGTP pyrophosphatase MutT (NUDIX family)
MRKLLTLAMVQKDGKVLLGMKKRGFGVGRWNGFGGKVEEGESLEGAALREVEEEVGITPRAFEERGVLEFSFENDEKVLEVHVFRVTDYDGEVRESEEMQPRWFDEGDIPYELMWPDDEYWMPLFFAGKKFTGTFHFDRPSDAEYTSKILEQELAVIEE